MANFMFVKDGKDMDYGTQSISVKEMVELEVLKPLWRRNGRLTVEELANLGIQLKYLPDQTPERLAFEHISALYAAVPVFATRVAEWKAMYDELGIEPSASVADIAAAEEAKFGEDSAARGDFHDRFMGKRTEVMVNYQAAERAYCNAMDESFDVVDDFTTWTDFPTLVKWLPGTYEEKDIPARREVEIVASSEREDEIKAQLAADAAAAAATEEEPVEE